jgi:hypothetical protein
MRRFSLLLMSIALMFSALPSAGAESAERNYTESELNQILINSGVPDNQLDKMIYDDKLFIVTNSGEDITYKGSELENEGDSASIMATIPNSEITLDMQYFETYVNGSKVLDIYPTFEWKTSYRPKNNTLGVAVPSGWQIVSGQNSCQTHRQWTLSSGQPWELNNNQQCGGSPSTESVSGMAWTNFDDPKIGIYNYRYKGTMFFRAKRASGTAVRMVGNYVKDTTSNSNALYTVTLNWGLVGVSVAGNTGGIDTKGFSKDVSW